jgi:hypothetical protein
LLLLIHKWFRYLCENFVGVAQCFCGRVLKIFYLEIYKIDRAWFMIYFGESYTLLAPLIIEIWIFEISKIRTLKSNNLRSIIARIFWFAYYCSSGVSEQESIDKKVGAFGGPWPPLFHVNFVITTFFKYSMFHNSGLFERIIILPDFWVHFWLFFKHFF